MNTSMKRHFVSTLSFLFLAFLVPLYLYLDINADVFDMNIALSWFILAYVALQLSLLMVRNLERILELTFWIFTYVFMGVVPFVQLVGNRFPWVGFYSYDDITKCLLIVALGIVCYQFGLKMANRKKTITPEAITEHEIHFSTSSFILLSVFSLLLSLVLIYKGSGFEALFLPRNDMQNQYEVKSIGLLIDQFAKEPLFICLILGIWMWKKKKFTDIHGYMMVVVLIVANLIVSNPISNARYWFGSVVLTVLLLLIPWKRMGLVRWGYGYLTIFLLIFPYADLFRNRLDATLKIQKITDIMMDKGDYDAFQMILNTSKYTDLLGIIPGRQLLSTLFFWIPRSMWLNKPYSSGQEIGEALGYKFTNLSCPLWAESYVNFGYIGVIVIFILYGYITTVLQNRYILGKKSSIITISHLLVPFLSAFQVFMLRGDLQNAITYLSVYLVLAYMYGLKRKAKNQQLSLHTYSFLRR